MTVLFKTPVDSVCIPILGWVSMVALLLIQCGCHHIGPKTIVDDRLPYNEAVAESWKEQTLLNIVKQRYGDTVAFAEVSQVISGYSRDRSGGVEIGTVPGVVPGLTPGDRFRTLFNLRTSFSDRPTITYTPQTGSQFLRRLARPLRPEVVLFLIEAGYPADVILELTVESINGVRNRSSSLRQARLADPEFQRLLQVFRRAQLARGLSTRVKINPEKVETTVLLIRSPDENIDSDLVSDLAESKKLLNLDEELSEFRVVQGSVQLEKNQLAIQTRPLLGILSGLAQFVDVPDHHIADGSAQPLDVSCSESPLRVHCSDAPPADCYAAVPYRGCWYWVDDRDIVSKRTFIYLFFLLAQADHEANRSLPLVTIPVN